VPRRVSLPGADELFRTTGGMALQASSPGSTRHHANGETPAGSATPAPRVPAPAGEADPSAQPSPPPGKDAGTAGSGSGSGAGSRSGSGGRADGGDAGAGAGPDDETDSDSVEHSGRENGEATPAELRTSAQARAKARATRDASSGSVPAAGRPQSGAAPGSATAAAQSAAAPRRRTRTASRRPSGRERHDEKITVYVSAEELMDLEHARLVLRGEHGLAVDRGRIVREAVAVVLADLESRGDASILVRRLRGR
jgi:hypothetical protein